MARYQNPDEPESDVVEAAAPAASNTEAPSEVNRTIKVESLPKLQERVAVMVRKATKLGLAPLVLTVGKTRVEYRVETIPGTDLSGGIGPPAPDTRRVPYEVVDITLRGESPKLPGGWRFVATIDHTGPLNVVRAVPGGTAPMLYRTRPPICEHCRLSRDRRDTFVVENDAHKLVQVGRSCLVDFMGHKSAAAIADLVTAYSDLWSDLDDPDSLGGGGGRDLMDPVTFLAFAADEVAEFGFMSKRVADEQERPSTADLTMLRMYPPLGRKYVPATDAGKAKAEKVLAWAETIDLKTPNDYLYNLKATLAKEAFSWRDVGLAASAISAYDRDMARSRATGDRGSGEHFGTVGERERVKVRVEKIFDLHSDEYGTSYLHMMRTVPEGHVAKWKTGTERLKEGQEYDFVCMIAEHGEYKGTKQTILKRCTPYISPEEKKAEKELAAITADLAILVESDGVAAKGILEAPSYERPAQAKARTARQKLLASGLLQVEARDVRQWDGTTIKVDFLTVTPAGLHRALWLGLEIISRSTDDRWMNEPDVGVPHVHGDKATPLIARGLVGREDKRLFLSDVGLAELERLRGAFAGSGKTKRKKNPTDDDERETTDARTAATVMLREYGFGGSSGDEEDARRPRRVTPQNVKDYCSYQARVVSEDDAKLAAAMVNRRLADWHAEHPGEAEEDERVREGYERELHEGTPRERAARRANPVDRFPRDSQGRPSMAEFTRVLHGADPIPMLHDFHDSRGPARTRWIGSLDTLSTGELLDLSQIAQVHDAESGSVEIRQSIREILASRQPAKGRLKNPANGPVAMGDVLDSRTGAAVMLREYGFGGSSPRW